MQSSNKRNRRRSSPLPLLAAEQLEDRCVPATFGVAWPDARNLHVSFPTDNTDIGAYANSLRAVFDQVADRKEWQEAALRAFQTWAVQTNLNIGLVPDRGDAFGAVGLATSDPRFGEFRIGAFPQPGVLASALPFQQGSGTWSGDVLLNTQANWFLADWNSTSAITVPPANEKGPSVELFTVLLHEAGNALGVADNTTSGTVMFTNYERPKGRLTSSDITQIRRIYGTRTDPFETTSNNSRTTATRINTPAGYDGTTPLSVRGSLNTMADVDFYRFRPLPGQEKVAVRLMASGVSLLKSRIEVLDSRGVKISDAKVDSIFENNMEIEIGSLNPSRDYFIRVARNSSDVFGIGDYLLELDYRPSDQRPPIKPPAFDADADDGDNSVEFVDIDQLFSNGLVDSETVSNDTLTTAQPLQTTFGYLTGTRYDAISSLSSFSDKDLFRFRAPDRTGSVLNIDITPLGNSAAKLNVVVMNTNGDRIPAFVQDGAGGARSLTISAPQPGAVYIVGIRSATDSPVPAVNYAVTINFATDAPSVVDMFQGDVQGATHDYSNLTTYKPQLFRFDLSSSASTANEGVQLTFIDIRTGATVFIIAAGAGSPATEYAWLPKGEYVLKAEARSRNSQSPGLIRFTLRADVLSDDQGPNPVDPTQIVPPVETKWSWRDYPISDPPVIDVPFTVVEDPWLNEEYLSFFPDYYALYFR